MKITPFLQQVVSAIVLLVLLLYTYSLLFVEPYYGFYVIPYTGIISNVFINSNDVRVGDKIEQVANVTWKEFQSDAALPLLQDISAGEKVEIILERDGTSEHINWVIPGWTRAEFLERLNNYWWIAYIFWLAGLVTVLVIRPHDLRQKLLAAFFYLTALWLMIGAAGINRMWYSTLTSRALILFTVPVYLHLHWIFPNPLKKIRTAYWISLYVITCALALAQLWQQIPPTIYILGGLLAMSGSIILLALHLILNPEQRRDVAILFTIAFLAFLPTIIAVGFTLNGPIPLVLIMGLLALAGLPIAYFYVAYRQQPGWLEFRANRLVALYLFLILLFTITFLLISLITGGQLDRLTLPVFVLTVSIVVFAAVFGFSPFQRWVDKHLLGMPLDRESLVETFAARITTSLSREALSKLLREDLMPTLQIRQSSIIQKGVGQEIDIVYRDGIPKNQMPDRFIFEGLSQDSTPLQEMEHEPSWVRLAIPLKMDRNLQGIWLLGRHDPDDVYSHEDIRLLELLGNQTAIALSNINQTELLQNLYAANIQRHEEVRTNLSRSLHDDILNDLAILGLERRDDERFATTYTGLVNRIRLMIRGLRPAMLDYGIWHALDDSIDDLQDRKTANTVISFEIPRSELRYPAEIEQHLFRIIQQVLENALEHAQANTLTIRGQLQQSKVTIAIEDDGIGLPDAENLRFSELLANNHFGLVGMFERAELIGAQLNITSAINEFTRVDLVWHPADDTKDANP